MPWLIHSLAGVVELVAGLHQDIGGTGNQIMSLQSPIYSGFRDKVTLVIGIAHRQFSWGEFRFFQGKANNAQTRDLLLPTLMSGEIRLRDAEKAVEAVA